MANHQARMSMYSVTSDSFHGTRGGGQQSQVSTTTLLNAIHNIYLSSQSYQLDAGSSVVVNTWLTATQLGPDGRSGGTIDKLLAARAWEHARRRAEDGCIVLSSLHTSTPSLLTPFLASLPISIPSSLLTSLEAVQPFLRCVTPYNPSTPRQSALGITLTLNLAGNLTAATLALSQGGIDTTQGLLNIPTQPGYRAFDVFYYLLTSASTPAEREFLSLKSAADYTLLARSGTYDPPSYLPTADDSAAADDFRRALKEIGIKGSSHRNLISALAGLLKLGNTLDYNVDDESLEVICEDVSGLLGLDPDVLLNQCTTEDRQILVGGLYEAVVDWVITKANGAIAAQMSRIRDGDESLDGHRTPTSAEDNGDTVCITVIEVPDPNLGKALSMRGVFDDSAGINAEMKEDGVDVAAVENSVQREMQSAMADAALELGTTTGSTARERQRQLERREIILEKVGFACEDEGFLKKLLFPIPGQGITLGRTARMDLSSVLGASRVWYHLSLHPTDENPASLAALPSVTSAWSAGAVSRQLRAWRLAEWANRRNKNLDFTADFDLDEFYQRFAPLGCREGRDGIESWILERGWSNGEVVVGRERVWMRETSWWEAESMLDLKPPHELVPTMSNPFATPARDTVYGNNNGSGFFPPHFPDQASNNSNENLMTHQRNQSQLTFAQSQIRAPSVSPSVMRNMPQGDYGLGTKGDNRRDHVYYTADGEYINTLDPNDAQGKHVEEEEVGAGRRAWVGFVWAMTFWIPSFLLHYVGRMKRPDVRMAWREKVTLVWLIFIMNAIIVFVIIFLGRIICPNFDKAWLQTEVDNHSGKNDFWVSIHGNVYDITKFWKIQHSDSGIQTTNDLMEPFGGLNLDRYFTPPLPLSCPGLGIAETTQLRVNPEDEPTLVNGKHTSGFFADKNSKALSSDTWYTDKFLPKIKEYYHGELVWNRNKVQRESEDFSLMVIFYEGGIYNLTDYFETINYSKTLAFLDDKIVDIIKNNPGQDVTSSWNGHLEDVQGNSTAFALAKNSINCIKNTFYVGKPDFRYSPRCQALNYILLAFTILIAGVILIKFVSALQFGSKRRPSPQDKFVICQVPAYTEGEDSLRKALDSLTALQYDNKRKLICVICDGVIIGAGNDRPTPKIVLDILGVDPKLDPPALPFKSVGTGSEQLNYGKVYSGLYEFEGNVVPYIVVVKIGKESEQTKTKPGNRGKRDSQIMLMSFLNRVHHRAPMNPLELEMFHQINNIIGVDPELYEYLLMVDADTCVREDSLNRLVAACANNSKIAGICGETALQNEERSWWSMIQVYEYYISHHLSKAFESLFGSVTCLPGCFTMYRLRTADRGKPLIIADAVIQEYSIRNVDTLHKKNLLSLGEDRFLTTIMTKHFPHMSYKFQPDAYCQTAAPETWSVLLSQRRRWINSTIHNLFELMLLKNMCGFCCFSMRFVVFFDLFGTIILPATTVYLGYLIYLLASHTGPIPYISLAILAGVYGLQAIIFILKRQWQHVGWIIIYLLAFPIFSFILPIYSFWNQDNFTWGNTRIVIGEKGNKQVVAVDDKDGFDPRSIPMQRWDDYAALNNLPGRRGAQGEKAHEVYEDNYEMDDMRSVYSSVRQPSVLTGLQGRGGYMPPQSPAPFQGMSRQSTYGDGFGDNHMRQSTASFGDIQRTASPYQDLPHAGYRPSMSNLRAVSTSPQFDAHRASNATLGLAGGNRPTLGHGHQSTTSFDFQRGNTGPDDGMIVEAIQAVLRDVDLDTVTKKQVRALVEQKLQTELVGEKRTFMDRQIDHELANM
ncbi:class V chitin synthase [Xylaria bambusicola]|uniref:class V chitin synthase n=1 Tax=Xylaria bambusicola TaxID=326684 RepID=UPI0020081878|nr:class V chitin synthase [Xylaria bambusicola]KAI0520775.1 class V chitin synthase [Xylaria bambusicola]